MMRQRLRGLRLHGLEFRQRLRKFHGLASQFADAFLGGSARAGQFGRAPR